MRKMNMATADELETVKRILGTLIAWMAQSANSPISQGEANDLLNRLDNEGKS